MDDILHNREADDSTTTEDLESELASNAIGSTLYNKQWVLGMTHKLGTNSGIRKLSFG